MKILLNLIIALSLLAVLSCQKDQATNQSEEFDLDQILNNSNWVEITDTINHKPADKDYAIMPIYNDSGGVVINSWEEIIKVYKKYLPEGYGSSADTVALKGDPLIDYTNRTLIIYHFSYGGGAEIRIRVFRNDRIKQAKCIIETGFPRKYVLTTYYYCFSVSKIPEDYTFEFIRTKNYDL